MSSRLAQNKGMKAEDVPPANRKILASKLLARLNIHAGGLTCVKANCMAGANALGKLPGLHTNSVGHPKVTNALGVTHVPGTPKAFVTFG